MAFPPPHHLSFVAIGAGPSNLSLAALARPHRDLAFRVFESRPSISWHPGMMVDNAALQVAPIKDLVSLVDPTSPYSFTAFLQATGRLYRALVAHRSGVSRQEFNQYFQWVSRQIEEIELGRAVRSVDFRDGDFVVETAAGRVTTHNLVIGVGRSPRVPDFARPHLGSRVFHSSHHVDHRAELAGRRVLVVGGGQSAAEIVLDLLCGERRPAALIWAVGRSGLFPLDDSPFANEWYSPGYLEHFLRHPAPERRRLLGEQALSSDGVSEDLLQQIYAKLYEIDYLRAGGLDYRILLGRRLDDLTDSGPGLRATLIGPDARRPDAVDADAVVLATGYTDAVPEFLAPLRARLDLDDGGYRVLHDYRVAWDGPADRRIYVQNAARRTHGVADPNLALITWRSATILNSLDNGKRYDLALPDTTVALA
ncbi:lysine N(6)-hydroxylase/L-ornithine N(5)-oxygenase family protein [Streptomyces sp. NPDC127039]|uniref:lysine N(6)-hydroxylase/L-ornithine N(5)-oxygenase family protein n=1 Tax=Streptomyces sp. NPDC127039 TaxID=3347115 RepID=UPI003663BF42